MSSRITAVDQDAWSFLDAVGEAVSVHGPDGMLVYANPRSRSVMAGLAEAMDHAPLGEIAWRARLPDGTEVPSAQLPVEITRRTGVPVRDLVVGFPGASGGVVWLRITTRRAGGPGALPCTVVATFTDVTEERRATRRLEQTIDDQRLIVEGLIEGVVFQDHDGTIVWSNRGAEEALGLSADQLHGRAPADERWGAVHEDGTPWPGEEHPAMVALRTGEPQLQRIMGIRRPDGTLRWIQINARPQLDDDDCVSGVVTSFLDVTSRRAAERERAAAQERLLGIVELSPIGMALGTVDGEVLTVNPAFANMLGRRPEDLIGRPRFALTHPEDRPREQVLMTGLLRGDAATYRVEKRYLHADGTVVWAQVDVVLLRDGDGEPEALLAQVQDIGARREQERRLEHLADHDPLTGLLNRRGFARALDVRLAHARRYGTGGALVLLDLDGFKDVNDALGHEAGDLLLVEIADLLRSGTRASDVVARLGGDEFAVLLPEGGKEAAEGAATAIAALVRTHEPLAGPADLRVSASVGVAAIGDGDEPAALVARADQAMYRVKAARSGRRAPGSGASGSSAAPGADAVPA